MNLAILALALLSVCQFKPQPKGTEAFFQSCPREQPAPTARQIELVEFWRPMLEPMLFGRRPLSSALVLAVIAEESGGYSRAESRAGAIGLMQIVNRPQWDLPREWFMSPINNIELGTAILASAIRNANGDIRLALAWYNCGEINLELVKGVPTNSCGSTGGYFYANRVLSYWCPMFEVDKTDNACASIASEITYRYGNLVKRSNGDVESYPARTIFAD